MYTTTTNGLHTGAAAQLQPSAVQYHVPPGAGLGNRSRCSKRWKWCMGASMLGAYLAHVRTQVRVKRPATTHACCVLTLCMYESSSVPVADALIVTVSLCLPGDECREFFCNTVQTKPPQRCPAPSRLQAPPVFITDPLESAVLCAPARVICARGKAALHPLAQLYVLLLHLRSIVSV